jgi:hypothetical protein
VLAGAVSMRGQGLICQIAQVEAYARGVGIGAAGTASGPVDPTATYVDNVRRAARARFGDEDPV